MNNDVNVVVCFAHMLERIKEETKDSEYTETYDIASMAVDESEKSGSVMDIAIALQESDTDKKMPESVKDFLKLVYQMGIDEGIPICMNNLACMYYTDRCGMKDLKMARKYYQMAADNGDYLSASNLGYIYYYGLDTKTDYELAYKYFSLAALMGEIEGIYKTGDMYRYGYYVNKSPETALYLYTNALKRYWNEENCKCGGNILKRMGDAYCEGIGVEPDTATALMYYQRAELVFYDQIKSGDSFVQKDLDYVIKKQGKLRKQIASTLPQMDWSR